MRVKTTADVRGFFRASPSGLLRGCGIFFFLLCFAFPGAANEEFFQAVRDGDAAKVRRFIAEGQDVGARDDYQGTALHLAAHLGWDGIAGLLLEAGADAGARNQEGMTPLHFVFVVPYVNAVEKMSRNMAEGKARIAEALLARGADVNARDDKGWTPLIYFATMFGRLKSGENSRYIALFFAPFMDAKADLDARDGSGGTALMWVAFAGGNEDIAEWLIRSKADVKLKDDDGMTALHWAALGGHEKTARLLVEAGAELEAKNQDGATPLFDASMTDKPDVLLFLLERGAEVNLYTTDGLTPLHAATGFGFLAGNKDEGESLWAAKKRLGVPEENFLRMTRALVEAGADVHARRRRLQNSGEVSWWERLFDWMSPETPSVCAQVIGHREVAAYLKLKERETPKGL